MIAKAWQWAKQQNQIRTNPIHGEEEIYITTTESFALNVTRVEESSQSGAIQVQDRSGVLILFV